MALHLDFLAYSCHNFTLQILSTISSSQLRQPEGILPFGRSSGAKAETKFPLSLLSVLVSAATIHSRSGRLAREHTSQLSRVWGRHRGNTVCFQLLAFWATCEPTFFISCASSGYISFPLLAVCPADVGSGSPTAAIDPAGAVQQMACQPRIGPLNGSQR